MIECFPATRFRWTRRAVSDHWISHLSRRVRIDFNVSSCRTIVLWRSLAANEFLGRNTRLANHVAMMLVILQYGGNSAEGVLKMRQGGPGIQLYKICA